MESKNKCKKLEFSTIVWSVLVVALCAAPASRAGFVYDSGPINAPPSDEYYWVTTGVTVDLYASGSYDVYIDDNGTVNFQAGSSADNVSAYIGSQLNMYGGTVSDTISAQGGVGITIYGTYESMVSSPIGAGHYDSVTNQVVVDDGTNGWNGDLTFTYEGESAPTTLTFSTSSNIQFGSTGGENHAPTAYAGEDVIIYTSEQGVTVLEGTATDEDGDALTYRWLKGTIELKPSTDVPLDGIVTLELSSVDQIYLPGVYSELHTLTLEVSDGPLLSTDLMDLSVFNMPPSAAANPPSMTVGIGKPISIGAEVADFDGDLLAYEWRKGAIVLESDTVASQAGGDPVSIASLTGTGGTAPFELGLNVLVIAVNDGVNSGEVSETVTVQVSDTEAPTLAPTASEIMLWPPNNTLRPVTIQANAEDNSGGPITLDVQVTSNEADEDDWVIDSVDNATGEIQLKLRADRSGSGDGRIYTVTITATDEANNSSAAIVEIRVSHNKRKN